jgi:hypothetical protein
MSAHPAPPTQPEEVEAKLRLMKAAPELLAVVQKVDNLGEYLTVVASMALSLRPHEREGFIRMFREEARAAIAAATGRNA